MLSTGNRDLNVDTPRTDGQALRNLVQYRSERRCRDGPNPMRAIPWRLGTQDRVQGQMPVRTRLRGDHRTACNQQDPDNGQQRVANAQLGRYRPSVSAPVSTCSHVRTSPPTAPRASPVSDGSRRASLSSPGALTVPGKRRLWPEASIGNPGVPAPDSPNSPNPQDGSWPRRPGNSTLPATTVSGGDADDQIDEFVARRAFGDRRAKARFQPLASTLFDAGKYGRSGEH